ncbi:transcription factor domain-containing protein [Aspergillus tubingensis]|nr:fungal-specific transcription factor domain-domain-containing protein [Aspergillus tubingensis]GFN10912.1 fungal-specific transcription factor domain-domain-containing protein [Aspergillus tubingensis]
MEAIGQGGAIPRLQLSSQVCDRCRIKKIRCDGLLPSCSNCRTAGASCVTSKQLKRRTRPRRHLEQQERLLDELRIQNQNLQREIRQLRASHSTTVDKSVWNDTAPGFQAHGYTELQVAVLMKKQFLSAFHRIFDRVEAHDPNLSPSDYIILRQIFLVLSITAWKSRSPTECNTYYLNTLECARLTTAPENEDLPGLQSHLLTCLYLQLTRKHDEWTQTCGQVVRLAQSLGLHRHSRRFQFCSGEMELRKRIWWCVYAVDVACSIVHGLPKMIQDDDVDTDLPVDTDLDDVAATDIPLPLPGETTSMATFILYVKLLRIFSSCLKSLYTTTKRRNGVAKITALDHELSVWRHSVVQFQGNEMKDHDDGLPDTLHMNSADQSFETLFLHFLGNVAVVLIHQPALTFDPKHPQFTKSLSRCVRAALNILSMLGSSHDNQRLHCLFPNKSSIVFQSALLCFYHQWMCMASSLTPSHNLDPLMGKIVDTALKLLDMHKTELVTPNTGSNTTIDVQTVSAAQDLVRLFSSRIEHAGDAPVSAVPASSMAQTSPSSFIFTPPAGLGSHEPLNFERESQMATIPLDFGILEDGILDNEWL